MTPRNCHETVLIALIERAVHEMVAYPVDGWSDRSLGVLSRFLQDSAKMVYLLRVRRALSAVPPAKP